MMSQPIAYALVAMVCYGVCDFIYKQAATAGIRADHFLMVQAWFFCSLVILYALATGTIVLDPAALWGMLAGVLALVGLYYFVRSLAAGSVSTNASIFRLNFIVTVALVVVLLGEPLTLRKITGLAFALLATWLLLGTARPGRRHARPGDARRRSLLQVAGATLAFGAANFFHTVGLRHGAVPETLAVAQAAMFMPLATIVVYRADRKLRPAAMTFRYSAMAAILLLGATIFMLRSVARRAGERAGADRADGIHRRRAAWHLRPARAQSRCARRPGWPRHWQRSRCWPEVERCPEQARATDNRGAPGAIPAARRLQVRRSEGICPLLHQLVGVVEQERLDLGLDAGERGDDLLGLLAFDQDRGGLHNVGVVADEVAVFP